MKIVLLIIIFVVCFNFILKQTFGSKLQLAVVSLLCAALTYFSSDIAVTLSKNQVAAWLADTALMYDVEVILSIEITLQIAFCMLVVRMSHARRRSTWKTVTMTVLRWFPGISIFPTLFYLLTVAIYSFTGVDFGKTTMFFSAGVLIAIPLLTYGLKFLLPEKEIRTEIFFLANATLGALGVLLSFH